MEVLSGLIAILVMLYAIILMTAGPRVANRTAASLFRALRNGAWTTFRWCFVNFARMVWYLTRQLGRLVRYYWQRWPWPTIVGLTFLITALIVIGAIYRR